MQRSSLLPLVFFTTLCLAGPLQRVHAAIVATGDVDPDPATTPWTSGTHGYVGYTAEGSLTVDADSDLYSHWGNIGDHDTAAGVVTVTGCGSTWTNTLNLYVGGYGSGTLNITGGAAVSNQDGCVGHWWDSTGEVTVDGAGSTWTNRYQLRVGFYGNGTLNITGGGAVSNRSAYVGSSEGSTGVVRVDGAGSTWTNDGDLTLGFLGGSGTLSITDGAAVTVNRNNFNRAVYVAEDADSTGTVHFSNGTLTTGWLCASPSQLTGTGTINTRGLVSDVDLVFDSTTGLSQTLTFNNQPDQSITLNLDMSDPSNVGDLGAGWGGKGSMEIRDGVSVIAGPGHVGYKSDSTGVVTVTGTGSTWTSNGNLNVGAEGSGTLNIRDGGAAVCNNYAMIGKYSGSTGVVTVDGAGSTWTNRSDLRVGVYGNGTLNITGGAAVSNGSAYVGSWDDSTGAVTVDGAGSTWTNHGDLLVGYACGGTVTISGGAAVSSGNGRIFSSSGFTSAVTVTGTGSTWTNSRTLSVGGGSGMLIVTDGGTVTAKNAWLHDSESLLTIAVANGSSLTLDNGSGSITNDDTIRIIAGAGPEAGAEYAPIAAGVWEGSGVYQALGGTWDEVNHVLTVSDVEDGTAGAEVVIDLLSEQRVMIDDGGTGWSVGASFLAMPSSTLLGLEASPIGGEILDGLEELLAPSASVLGGWEFTVAGDYASGDPAYFSFDVGAGYSRRDLVVWHRDGADWQRYAASDLTYDGTYASFTVTDFSGYAVTTVPEPATMTLLLTGLALAALLAGRRRRRRLGGAC